MPSANRHNPARAASSDSQFSLVEFMPITPTTRRAYAMFRTLVDRAAS